MANDRDFLGKGLRFPVSVNLNGGVSSSALEENVRQCIFIILGTAPGERINRPEFGCQLHDLMYKFEPRVAEVRCQARPNPDEPNRLDIRIEYVIAGKHDKRNLVFPFYLKNDDDEETNGVTGKNGI
jgi:uncharacterized protein